MDAGKKADLFYDTAQMTNSTEINLQEVHIKIKEITHIHKEIQDISLHHNSYLRIILLHILLFFLDLTYVKYTVM